MNENITKLEMLLKDEVAGKAIFGETIEETQKNLKNAGITFSIEELTEVLKGMAEADKSDSEELAENDLEAVSGGAYKDDCYRVGKTIGKLFGWAVELAKAIFK